ncbi:MAG: DUF4292 domain-containing protein [Deltaproteobacteria bacterium]|nr:DUF4292 domain-containing protein [Deltaproteobacteria bacterium]MBW2018435.1 DUF4292 domain-containing protein [Deltaproteobacteria bacterium]MBW2073722.1 DUF4292 domain-containing protein [Deltaproteobacteria bacterium]RLB83594.1 MAG: hypothetical protein DRH17_01590 [Deltaproteobacteria bacterium]
MRSYTFLILTIVLLPLCLDGCARSPKTLSTPHGPDVSRILESLEQRKNNLKTFKGVGRFKIVRGSKAGSSRMVWIGSQPQKLRIETLGPWGQPTMTFVINGASFFVHSRQDNRCFKGNASVDNLSRFISVPVSAQDLFDLLSGQAPILPFHRAKIQALKGEGRWLLSLYKKWGRLIEKIWLRDDAKVIEQVEVFDGWGNLQYRIAFSEFQQVESICVPQRIVASEPQGVLWVLMVEKFWTQVSIPDGAYTLEVPEAQMIDLDS